MSRSDKFTRARDIDDLAQKLNDAHLTCRVDSHSRQSTSIGPIADVSIDKYGIPNVKGGVILKTLRCRNRCGVKWTQILDRTGKVLWETNADYRDAPGYLVKGVGRLKRADRDRLRLEQATRWMEQGKKAP